MQLIKRRHVRGKTSTFGYDALGHQTSTQTPELVDRTFEYNPTTGLLEKIKNDAGQVVHQFFYDGYLRLIKDKNGLNEETQFAHDNNGNVNSVTDALLKVWSYVNDALGRVTSWTTPISGTTSSNGKKKGDSVLFQSNKPAVGSSSVTFLGRPRGRKFDAILNSAAGCIDGASPSRKRQSPASPLESQSDRT